MKKSVKRSRRAIIVLGMHRSGTSALARTLNLCGVDLGSNLMPPGPEDNVKGFWEHLNIFQANEKLLHGLNSSWDDVRALPDRWWTSDFAEAYKLEIISVLERDFSNSPFWGVKDPRICRFLPLWHPILEQTDNKPFFLIIVRNPLEVVASLSKRDGFSKGKSCLLWLKHLIESEKGTRNSSRVFVTYDELLSDWNGLLSRVEKTFGFKWPKNPAKASSEIKSFLQDSMRHNRVTDTTLIKDKTLSKWIRDLYQAINRIVDGDDTRLIKAVNTIEAKLKEAVSLYDPALTEIWERYRAHNTMLQERNQQLDDINNRLEGYSQDRGYHLSSIDHLKTNIKEKDDRIQQLDSELVVLRDQLSEIQRTIAGRETEVTHLETDFKERDERIQKIDAELAGLREEFAASQQAVKEHKTKVAQLQADIKERDEHVQRLESDSAGLQEQCTTLQSSITEREAEVAHLQGRIKEKNEHIQKTDAELSGLREELFASQQAVKEHESKVSQLQTEIKERDEQVQRLESNFAGLQEQYTALQGTITERDAEVVHLQNSIKVKDEHIQKIDTEITGLRKEFTASQQAVKEYESKVSHLEAEIKENEDRIHQLDADVGRFRDEADSLRTHMENYRLERESIFDSTSWKLTAPLRWVSVSARNFKHKIKATRYLFNSQYRLIKQSGLFDAAYYLEQNPDVALLGVNPIVHYLEYGAKEGRDPSQLFDTSFYLVQNSDVAKSATNPLLHYIKYGNKEREKTNTYHENFVEQFDSISNTVNYHPSSELEQNGLDEEYIYRAYRRPEEQASYKPEENLNTNPPNTTIKLIAFYFPQYHPFEENEKFWGKGFTEWTSTTKALPLFEGQYQPRLPGELGFYDTRIKEVIVRQIELAKLYGIAGFCFHHYFFDGKPVMRAPFNHIMTNKDLDIPFCLHWANEPWTIRWDGYAEKGGVLLGQHHTPEDDFLFFKDIEPALKDERYIRINNRPLLIIYRPSLFPDIKSTTERWRELGHKSGIGELFLAVMQTGFDEKVDPKDIGFDAAIEYPPHNVRAVKINDKVNLFDPNFQGNIFSYSEMVKGALERPAPDYKLFRGVMPDWDCTPRRRDPDIFIGGSPEKYQRWLEGACIYTQRHLPTEERFIFINAWNEWAEGTYLEPDRRYGYAYLQATREALECVKII